MGEAGLPPRTGAEGAGCGVRRLKKYVQGRWLMVMLMILVGAGNAAAQTGGWLIVRNAIDNGIVAKDTRYLAISVGVYLAVAAAGWILQAYLIRGLAAIGQAKIGRAHV